MLHDSKDMPKSQTTTAEKSIEKYGGDKMYFASPIECDKVMLFVSYGKLLTVGTIRDYFIKQSGADFTEPITAGRFVSIVAWASYQRSEDKTPYWRTLKANGEIYFDTGEIKHFEFPTVIAHTRNYYIHYDERIKEKHKILTEEELKFYNRSLLQILEFYILVELGFSERSVLKSRLIERWGRVSQDMEILRMSRTQNNS